MNDSELTVIDPPAVPAVRGDTLPAAAAPTIEQTLHLAVERGADPATLERLTDLFLRVSAHRAEQAMNEAMARFRQEVGPIIKNREAVNPKNNNALMYRYADLSEITKVCDAPLFLNGLSYSWDTDIQNDQTVITCIIRHVQGASRSAKFACKGSGTPIMNAAQVSASAVTFGRRYSLLLALGLIVDDDDDGRRAVPGVAPDHDTTQPKVEPRGQRKPAAPADPNLASKADLHNLLEQYRRVKKQPAAKFPELAAFARDHLRSEADMTRATDWTLDAFDAVKEALQ